MSSQQNQKNVKFITTQAPSVGEEGYIEYCVSLVKKNEDLFKPIAEIIPQYDHTSTSRDRFYSAAYKRMFKHLGFVTDKHKIQKDKQQYLNFLQEMCIDINGRKRTKKRTETIKKIQKAYTALYRVIGKPNKVIKKDYQFLTDFLKKNKIFKTSKEHRKYKLDWRHARKNFKVVLFKPNTVKQQETIINANNSAIPFPEQLQESKNMFGAEHGNTIFSNNNIIQNNIFNDKSDEMNDNEYSEGNLDELSEVDKQSINNDKITKFNLEIDDYELLKP